jgi:hypothetical protein
MDSREWLKNRERNVRLSHYIPLIYGLELNLFNCAPNPLKEAKNADEFFKVPFRGFRGAFDINPKISQKRLRHLHRHKDNDLEKR